MGEGQFIGLRYLREKLSRYDPLDILVSMLHIAYEEQVLLRPVYFAGSEHAADIVIVNMGQRAG